MLTTVPSLEMLARQPHHVSEPGGGCVRAYNETALEIIRDAGTASVPEIIVCASDDVHPIKGWDRLIEERIGNTRKSAFLACSDGRSHMNAVPLQIVTRAWIEKRGYIFHPRFKSVYADNWLLATAKNEGALIRATDLVFEHKHPFMGTAKLDEVYEAENSVERYAEGLRILTELIPKKISLCMICGNEASVILNCLQSAAPAFDELCLVRAIGEQGHDDTLALAVQWCCDNSKSFAVGEYQNRRAGLNHVDDFGAARNVSFEMATGDWILWLDCDDYLDEVNCRRIREAVSQADFMEWSALYCSYLVEKQGGEIQRERLIRRGKGRWKNAIHETCAVDGPTGNCPQVKVFHGEHRAKHQSSAARNSTILERAIESAPRHYFYLQAEQKMLGKKPEAIAAGRAALALLGPDQAEELYNVRLNLSELEPDRTIEHLLEALRLQPHRREALAYLCQKNLIEGDLSNATSYFRMMDALPLPSPLPWTHQGLWYRRTEDGRQKTDGWGRNLLRVRLLRAGGQTAMAEAEHQDYLMRSGLCRGRGGIRKRKTESKKAEIN
jgi:hypothetical protein